MASSSDGGQRRKAAVTLREKFGQLEDKEAAWEDLIRLTGDQDSYVRMWADDAL